MDIRSWITHKVRSQRGASLSMALMLMLVCTTVAAIVLAAGTAAAGRFSQLKSMDRSYYNVTSAAKVFSEMIGDGYTITVVRECDKAHKDDDKWTIDGNAKWSLSIDENAIPTTQLVDNLTLFERLTCDSIFEKVDGYIQQKDLSGSRFVTESQIKSSMYLEAAPPIPLEIEFGKMDYNSFKVSVASTDSTVKFNDVEITIKRNDDDTFSFTFTEEATRDNPSPSVFTSVFTIGIDDKSTPTETPEGGLRWETAVTWTYLYTIAGGA